MLISGFYSLIWYIPVPTLFLTILIFFNYFFTAITHVFLPTPLPSWISQNVNHTSRPKTDTAPEYWAGGWCLAQSSTKKKRKNDSWTLPWQRLHCECYKNLKFLKAVSEQWMISTATTTFRSVTTPRQHFSHGQYAGKLAKFWSCAIAKQNGRRLNNWIRCYLLHNFEAKWSILIWLTAPSCQANKVVTSPSAIIPSNLRKVKSNRFHSIYQLKTWILESARVRVAFAQAFCISLAGCLAFVVSRLFG